MAKVVKNKFSFSDTVKEIAQGITSVFVFILLVVFPLYTHDAYFDILGARYVFFKVIVLVHAILLSMLGLFYLASDEGLSHNGVPARKRFINAFLPKNIIKHINIVDVFFFLMLVVMVVSTIGSDFKEESITGNAGRYQGLECWIFYFVSYICISRTYKFNRMHLDFAILAGSFSCVWCVTDFFRMDIFKFFVGVNEQQKYMFVSSIGNLNTFTNYSIMVFAVAAILFALERKSMVRTIYYGVCTFICVVGSVFGIADNAVLGFFIFFVISPFILFKNRRGFTRYLMILTMFLFSLTLVYYGTLHSPWGTWASILLQISGSSLVRLLFIPFLIVTILITYLFNNVLKPIYEVSAPLNEAKPLDSKLPFTFRLVWIILIIVGFVVVLFMEIDINVTKKFTELWRKIPFYSQLEFNDDWGTHRGHNWRIAFTNFKNFNWFKKLFGYGPDTYLIVTERSFYQEMVDKYGEVYDSAHNEYINYLICEGVFGLICYLGIFISALKEGFKQMKNNEILFTVIMAVICYMFQAIVNIAIPITTPIFFTFMYMCVAMKYEKKDILNN